MKYQETCLWLEEMLEYIKVKTHRHDFWKSVYKVILKFDFVCVLLEYLLTPITNHYYEPWYNYGAVWECLMRKGLQLYKH